MLPEVFECPDCERQFVLDLVEDAVDHSVHCPQCKRYLGEKDVHFILRTEIEGLRERLRIEKERFEKDEATYALEACDPELRAYGHELHKVIRIVDQAMRDLASLEVSYR